MSSNARADIFQYWVMSREELEEFVGDACNMDDFRREDVLRAIEETHKELANYIENSKKDGTTSKDWLQELLAKYIYLVEYVMHDLEVDHTFFDGYED